MFDGESKGIFWWQDLYSNHLTSVAKLQHTAAQVFNLILFATDVELLALIIIQTWPENLSRQL